MDAPKTEGQKFLCVYPAEKRGGRLSPFYFFFKDRPKAAGHAGGFLGDTKLDSFF
jgi:hypothetical protein